MTFKGMNIIDMATKNFSMIQSKEEKKERKGNNNTDLMQYMLHCEELKFFHSH